MSDLPYFLSEGFFGFGGGKKNQKPAQPKRTDEELRQMEEDEGKALRAEPGIRDVAALRSAGRAAARSAPKSEEPVEFRFDGDEGYEISEIYHWSINNHEVTREQAHVLLAVDRAILARAKALGWHQTEMREDGQARPLVSKGNLHVKQDGDNDSGIVYVTLKADDGYAWPTPVYTDEKF